MKNATEHAKTLKTLLKKLKPQVTLPEESPSDPLHAMIYAFLNWESSRNQADAAYGRLLEAVVDLNDLRVSDPAELVAIIGEKYHRAHDRCWRLTRALHSVYRREHAVDLSRAAGMSKRDARAYLDELEGMVPFVSAYVTLFAFGGHAIPLDDPLMERLKADEVLDPDANVAESQAFLEHQVRADDAAEAHYLLRAYIERPIRVDLGRTTKTPSKKKATGSAKKSTTKKAPTKSRR